MELDDAYANAPYIKDSDSFAERLTAASTAFVAGLEDRAQLGISYGDGERLAFDLFMPEGAPKGTMFFIHGGYWLALDRSYFSHLAAGALAHGWAVAMPSYDLCPDVRIADITRQIALALEVVAAQTVGPIAVTGHSAGGHLSARMLDKRLVSQAVAERISAVVPISPLSDLRPLLQTSMNNDFGMDEAAAIAESPIFMTDRYVAKVTVWVGSDERPAFLDQAQWLADAWGAGQFIAPGENHFTVIEALADAESEMVRVLTA
ncbi:MAG: alpha/beta hydrolase [Rhodobacteraceae bacterium]|nr:alpha/beta hydrolase [Paracoccaceae bacterium]